MVRHAYRFLSDETGAVTVDWVVLAAISAGFGIMVFTTLGSGANDVAATMETSFTAMEVAPLQELGYSQ
ncbi:Flp family type IVb pilin [Pararhodobacter zhoushanensis]|uniref:Flp family type IVb pilin n=1 Tax=Pararhodobacter zhoushanensis TaxID=2479545 RepID=UPI000F8F3E6D|nr:hypothetical protein [Pararhodobacter zhoushanensis]